MLLAIDSGNTNVVFSVYDGDELQGVWRCSNNPRRTADEYMVWLMQLMELEGVDRADVDSAIIASVVPEALFHLISLCRRYFGCEPLVVGETGVDIGIEILTDRPEQVGADRLVNALAAHDRYRKPLIVVDFGTATTFDVVDGDGNYCGGVIAPGINLSLEALYLAASKLPRVEIRPTEQVIGKATVPAMQSGIFWGYVGLIEGLIQRIRSEWGVADMPVVATGGLAPMFAEATSLFDHIDRDLTIHGLVLLHRRNTR
ncbi:MAG: type III pantothenate kinase [Gammaproteobacteria bacterium]|nr:type III pantothenate kinase [Gammaproteobacteria bacterium]